MNGMRIVMLCLSAALVCTSLRTSHPQIASAVALAAGVGALTLSLENIDSFAQTVAVLEDIAEQGGFSHPFMLKICGITIVAEFTADICRDAGEVALAHRIDVGVKMGILVAALPTATKILDKIMELTA